MEDNITALYNELKGKYEINSEDDFRNYLRDANNREALRKELEAEYEVGDSASFSNYLGFAQDQQPQQEATNVTEEQPKNGFVQPEFDVSEIQMPGETKSGLQQAVDNFGISTDPETYKKNLAIPGTREWRTNVVKQPGENPYNGRNYGEIYDEIIQSYGKNLAKAEGDPYAEARASILQAGITDDMKPEDADKLALNIRHGYANRYADNASKQMVGSLPDQVPNIDSLIDGLWYTRDMQSRINQEAGRLGLRKENYVNYYIKPHIAKALSDRYGYDKESAKLISGRLLSQDEHTTDIIRQNEASQTISDFAAPLIQDQFQKLQKKADEIAQPTMLNLNATPEQRYLAGIQNWQATDPATVWEKLKPTFDQMGSWLGIVGNEKLFDQIAQMAEAEGMPVNAYIDKYVIPSYENAVLKEFERIAVEREMPKDTYDYIVGKLGESLVANIGKWFISSEQRRRAQREAMQLTETGQGEYKPGFGAKVAGGAAAMVPDMILLPGGGPFGLTARFATSPVTGMAQELITRGWRPLFARMAQSSVGGGLSLGAFEGLKGAVEGGLNPEGYEHLMAEDKRNAGEILADMVKGGFVRGLPSAVAGTAMVGGPVGQKISNGRGLLANTLGWGTQVGIDAAGATALNAAANLPKIFSGDITAEDLSNEFFENVGTFAALGLHSKGKEFASLAKGARSVNGVEFTKQDVDTLEDHYMQPLRDIINDIDRKQRGRGLIAKSHLDINEEQERKEVLAEAGQLLFGDAMKSYSIPQDLKVKLCTAFNIPIPEYALKPTILETVDKVLSQTVEAGFDNLANTEYNKPGGVAEKVAKGEPLTNKELTLRLLFQDNKRYNELGEKMQAGEELTPEEQEFVLTYNNRLDIARADFFNSKKEEMATTFEKKYNLKKGTILRMLNDLKEGKAVENPDMLAQFEAELNEDAKTLDEYQQAGENPTTEDSAPVEEAPKINKVTEEAPVEEEAPVVQESEVVTETPETTAEATEETPAEIGRADLADKVKNGRTNTIIEVTLIDGRKAYVVDGDPNNEFGRITLADENGDIIKETVENGYTIDRLPVDIILRDHDGNKVINEQTIGEFLGQNPENAKTEEAPKSEQVQNEPAMSRIPVTDGEPVFEEAKPEDTIAALTEQLETLEAVTEMVDEQIGDLTDELKELSAPVKGKNKKHTTMSEKLKQKKAVEALQKKVDYWNSVKELLNNERETKTGQTLDSQHTSGEIDANRNAGQEEIQAQGSEGAPADDTGQSEISGAEVDAGVPPVSDNNVPGRAPVAPEKSAQQKVQEETVRQNVGKSFVFTDKSGMRTVITIDKINDNGTVEVTRQDFDKEGNHIVDPTKRSYPSWNIGKGIIDGNWKKVATPEEQLREKYKGKKNLQKLFDVLSDEEMEQIAEASRTGDSEKFDLLVNDYYNSHAEDLILRDRDERNTRIDQIMNGGGSRESKLQRIRKIYQEYGLDDAVLSLDDNSLMPGTLEELVSDLHSRQPKKGEGPIAYYSYRTPDGHEVVGMQSESGHGKKSGEDTKAYAPWLAPEGKGISLIEYAERIHSQLTEAQQEQYSVQDVRNAINSLFGGAERPSDITMMTIKRGVIQAEQAARRMEEAWIDGMSQQKVSKTYADHLRELEEKGKPTMPAVERALRDVVMDIVKKSGNEGIEVITDTAEAEKISNKAKLSKAKKRALETVSIPEKEHQQTVVSSADGAKILKNLDNFATKLDNLTNNPVKTFIGSLAKELEATKHGSNTDYASFVTDDGTEVTIRLANHPATVSNFDNHGEDYGISIVISHDKKSGGINNDGKAHVIEYFYNDIKLRKSYGKPLADIVRAISDALHTGEYIDPVGIAEREEVNADEIKQHKAEMKQQKVEKPIFYSNAMKAVEGIKQEKATPEQWLKMIEKSGGLKAGEDKWLGLSDWLKEQQAEGKKSITKQEIQDYIRQNQIQVADANYEQFNADTNPRMQELRKEFNDLVQKIKDEKAKIEDEANTFNDEMFEKYGAGWAGDPERMSEEDRKRNDDMVERWDSMNRLDVTNLAFREMEDKYGDDFAMSFDVDANGKIQPIEEYNELGITDYAAAELGVGNPINSTRLRYTTNGLDNKKEIALVVPTIEPYNQSDEIHFGDAGGGRAVAWVRFGDTYAPNMGGDPNSLADGVSKVLVIDEIQSKRHQDAREKGYKEPLSKEDKERVEQIDKERNEIRTKLDDLLDKYENRRFEIAGSDAANALRVNGTVPNNKADEWDALFENDKESQEIRAEMASLKKQTASLWEEKKAIYAKYPDEGVPGAPFEKNWHELAMKRMLRYAAENGYDKITWTTGSQQAERYDIGRVIASIERTRTFKDGVTRYDLYDHMNNDISLMVKDGIITGSSQNELEGKSLGDVVGKDLAVKMQSMKDEDSLSAHDFVLGGDGMKGFYDDILPRFMNKYGKKWGAKVGKTELPNLGQTMWSVDVTPEMKESVMQGQPMFFKTPDGEAYGFTYNGKIYIDPKIATSETPIHEYTHLWAAMKRKTAPEEWNQIKDVLINDKMIQPFINKVKEEYPELTGEGREEDFIEEVLTQYSGKHGAERLRKVAQEIAEKNGGDMTAKTIAEVAVRKMKSILDNFWRGVANMMGWKYTSADEIADKVLYDLLSGVNPNEAISEARGEGIKSQKNDRTLMGMHNISEEKLKKALKLGGLANPSMAVVDTNNGVLDNFGEISLIPKSDLIDKKKGRNAGTWASDAYTPRFPSTYLRISDKNRKKLKTYLDSLDLNDEMAYQLWQQFNDYYNSFSIKDNALQYAFLKEKGLADKVDYVRHDDVSPKFLDLIDKYGKNVEELLQRTRADEDLRKEIGDMIINEEISNAMKGTRRKEGETPKDYTERRKKEAAVIRKLLTDNNDMATFDLIDHFLRTNSQKMNQNGKFDGRETLYRASRYISDNKLQDEYAKYFADKAQEFGMEEMIRDGSDRMGRPRFKTVTLEDISRRMKKEGLAGGEGGFGDSPGALRAKLTPMLNTLEDMRREKGRLISHDDFEAEKDPYFEEVFHIQHDLFNGDYEDMLKVLQSGNMKATAKRLGYDLDAEDMTDLDAFKKLTINLPTEYFETKFERPVKLNEFEIAVVPDTTSPDVVKALMDAGLDVRTYARNADNPDAWRNNRRDAIMDAVMGRDDIRFQMVGQKGAAEADKAEGNTSRKESLKVAEELEKAGKESKVIKFATGWERGKDGLWRYETVDQKADILAADKQAAKDWRAGLNELRKKEDSLYRLYEALDRRIPKKLDSRYTDEQKNEYRKMRKQRDEIWKQYIEAGNEYRDKLDDTERVMKLGNILGDDHELFKYYPQLKDTDVRITPKMGNGVAGSYNPEEGIKLNWHEAKRFDNEDLNNDNLNGILVHEIQHAIQNIEGFAKGGNLYTATSDAGIEAIVKDKIAERDQYINKINMLNKILSNPEEIKLYAEMYRRPVEEQIKAFEGEADELAAKADRIKMYVDKIKHDKAPSMTDAQDLYYRLAGEVEARNASERINMSEEERRRTPIEKTEDYARDRQVVMMDYPDGESGSFSARLAKAIAETNTNPTEAQKEAGNYRKPELKFGGYTFRIENPKGSIRSGVDQNGHEWSQEMHDTYGYIEEKTGKDGDKMDFFINDDADLDSFNGRVYVIDQKNEDGTFDEHKIMYGYPTLQAAKEAYKRNYEEGWWDKYVMDATGVTKADFDKWLADSDHKIKPFGEYSRTKALKDVVKEENEQPRNLMSEDFPRFSKVRKPTPHQMNEDIRKKNEERRIQIAEKRAAEEGGIKKPNRAAFEKEAVERYDKDRKAWEKAGKQGPEPNIFDYTGDEEYRKAYDEYLKKIEKYKPEDNLELSKEDVINEREMQVRTPAQKITTNIATTLARDYSGEQASDAVREGVIERRRNIEELSADDSLYINNLKEQTESLAKELNGDRYEGTDAVSRLMNEVEARTSGKHRISGKDIRDALPFLIEAPMRRNEIARDINDALKEKQSPVRISGDDIKAATNDIDMMREAAMQLLEVNKAMTDEGRTEMTPEEEKLQQVVKIHATKVAETINDNSDRGENPVTADDVMAALDGFIKRVVPDGLKVSEDMPELKPIINGIRDWYRTAYTWLDEAGMRKENVGFFENYVNHVWNRKKSDADAYDTLVANRQPTTSRNMNQRQVLTYMDGIEAGLVPEFTEITDMMGDYSKKNILAWANKKMLNDLSFIDVVERDEDGEVTAIFPMMSSVAPSLYGLDKYKYYEVPGVGALWVYKEAADNFSQIFEQYEVGKFMKVYDNMASLAKKIELSWSGFHAGALSEVYAVQNSIEFGPKKTAQYFYKYLISDCLESGLSPAYANPEDYRSAAKHFVKLGATDDYSAPAIQNMSDTMVNFINETREVMKQKGLLGETAAGGLKPVEIMATAVKLINEGSDKILWTWLHDGLKIATFKMMEDRTNTSMEARFQKQHPELSIDEIRKMKEFQTELNKQLDRDGQYVNDMFGGQHWELINISPKQLRYMRRFLLSPDWLVSTQRHFLGAFGYGDIHSKARLRDFNKFYRFVLGDKVSFDQDSLPGMYAGLIGKGAKAVGMSGKNIDEWADMELPKGRIRRAMSSLICYAIGVNIFYDIANNIVNALMRTLDEQDEERKERENEGYVSKYKLMYPDGMKWFDRKRLDWNPMHMFGITNYVFGDYGMEGNALGKKTHVFGGHYDEGAEIYLRTGKQFKEFPDFWENEKGELEFPRPLINRLMGKANPNIRMIYNTLNYYTRWDKAYDDKQLEERIKKFSDNKTFVGTTVGLTKLGENYKPFWVPTQNGKNWIVSDMFFPSSKGFSPHKAREYFEQFMRAEDAEGYDETVRACVMNGMTDEQINEAINSAKSAIQSEINKRNMEGTDALQQMMDQFNATSNLSTRRKLYNKIRRELGNEKPQAPTTLGEFHQYYQDYLEGADREAVKSNDKYIEKAEASDMVEEARVSQLLQQINAVTSEINVMKDDGVSADSIKAFMDKPENKSLLQANEIYKKYHNGKSGYNTLKKQLGKDSVEVNGEIQNDKWRMQKIRDMRKNMLEEIEILKR